MRCPECGRQAAVLETRGIRRRYECSQSHRFTTVEQVTRVDAAPPAPGRFASVNVDEVLEALRAGETHRSVAERLGVSTKTIQRIKWGRR